MVLCFLRISKKVLLSNRNDKFYVIAKLGIELRSSACKTSASSACKTSALLTTAPWDLVNPKKYL